jgi:hypothetical protein
VIDSIHIPDEQRWASTDFLEYEYEYQPLKYEYEYEYRTFEYDCEYEYSENHIRNENFECDHFKICVQRCDSIIMDLIQIHLYTRLIGKN